MSKNYVEALPKEHMVAGLNTRYLDKKFYKKYIKEAQKLGIDPYWYVAHTIKELGGIREEGKSQKMIHRGPLSLKPHGQPGHRGARGAYGPGAVLPGDPAGRRFWESFQTAGISGEKFSDVSPEHAILSNIKASRKNNPDLFYETFGGTEEMWDKAIKHMELKPNELGTGIFMGGYRDSSGNWVKTNMNELLEYTDKLDEKGEWARIWDVGRVMTKVAREKDVFRRAFSKEEISPQLLGSEDFMSTSVAKRFKGESQWKDSTAGEQLATVGIRATLGDIYDPSKPSMITHDEMYDVEHPRNKFSMMFLSDIYHGDIKGGTSAKAFHRINPGERGYGDDVKEIYEGLKTRSEYQWIRDAVGKPKNQEDVLMTDWLNSENWSIGNTKSQVMGK